MKVVLLVFDEVDKEGELFLKGSVTEQVGIDLEIPVTKRFGDAGLVGHIIRMEIEDNKLIGHFRPIKELHDILPEIKIGALVQESHREIYHTEIDKMTITKAGYAD